MNKKNNCKNLINNNAGLTLLEMIITVAIVSVFFTAMAMTVPAIMTNYVNMKKMNKALEMSTIIENGLAAEFAKGWDPVFSDQAADYRMSYNCGEYIHKFPIEQNADVLLEGTNTSIKVYGRPLIYGAVYDTGFYDDYYAEIKLYKDAKESFFVNIKIYDENSELMTVSEKPLIMYVK